MKPHAPIKKDIKPTIKSGKVKEEKPEEKKLIFNFLYGFFRPCEDPNCKICSNL